MYLYKYFTNEEHMESFRKGEISFRNLAYYKHLESEGSIADNKEAEIEKLYDKNNFILKIGSHIIDNNDIKEPIKIAITDNNYTNYLILSTSTKDIGSSFKQDNPEYKYFVKFERNDFNNQLENFFIQARDHVKDVKEFKKTIGETVFDHINYLTWPDYNFFEHEQVHYTNSNTINLEDYKNNKRIIFSKNENFSSQHEYRHVLGFNYLSFDNHMTLQKQYNDYLYKIKNKIKIIPSPSDINFAKNVRFKIDIGEFEVNAYGKI